MKKFLNRRWEKHYHLNNKNRYLHLIVDSLALLLILVLLLTDGYLSVKNYGSILGTQSQENINANQNQNTNSPTATSSENLPEVQPIVISPTTIKFQSVARYTTIEGEQLGLGPIPPIAGQATKYWLFINVSGFDHNLSQTVVTAKLPENVTFTGKSSVSWGENIIFNKDNGEIKWQLGDLTANENSEPLGAAWEVEIIPTSAQIGQAAQLLNQLEIFAFDTVANKIIKQIQSPITTDLNSDNNGLVQAK